MKVFILSAGLGTRLRPLTNDRPKVMIEIGGKPVLEHLINLCKFHHFTEIVINLHYFPQAITNYFGTGSRFGVKIIYSHEKQIMGSGGALKYAQKLLKDDAFLVLNGDVMTNLDLAAMVKFHRKKHGIGTFLGHDTDHPFDSDLIEFNNDFLITKLFRPKPGDKFRAIAKSGGHVFEPSVLSVIPESIKYSLEKELIPLLLKKKQRLYAFYSDLYTKDMGTPERLHQVRKDYEAGKIAF